MPLDPKTASYIDLLAQDVARMTRTFADAVAGYDEVEFDVGRSRVLYRKGGEVLGEFEAELVGAFAPDDQILRWGWASRQPGALPQRIDKIFSEAQSYQITQFTDRALPRIEENEVLRVVEAVAYTARAQGVYSEAEGRRMRYYALFGDLKGVKARMSMQPPSRPSLSPAPRSSPQLDISPVPLPGFPPLMPMRQVVVPDLPAEPPPPMPPPLPRPTARRASSADLLVDDPVTTSAPTAAQLDRARTQFIPTGQIAHQIVVEAAADYLQALLVIVGKKEDPRGYAPILVLQDAQGVLRYVDPPASLRESTARFAAGEADNGALFWTRLEARMTRKPAGGTAISIAVV